MSSAPRPAGRAAGPGRRVRQGRPGSRRDLPRIRAGRTDRRRRRAARSIRGRPRRSGPSRPGRVRRRRGDRAPHPDRHRSCRHRRRSPTATHALAARDEVLERYPRRREPHAQADAPGRAERAARSAAPATTRISVDKLFPPLVDQVTAWADAIGPSLDEVYVEARPATTGDRPELPAAPRRLVMAMAEVLVESAARAARGRDRGRARRRERRRRDRRSGRGPIPRVEGPGARGAPRRPARRHLRAQHLRRRARGLTASLDPRGAGPVLRLRRQRARAHARGNRFPTGQPFPPAHPGCRCLLEVVE